MIITVTMNPAIDKTAYVDTLHVRGLNRLEQVQSSPGGKGINVSKTIKALGGESVASGFLAGNNGQYIIQCLEALQIQHDMVYVDGDTRVNLKVVEADKELTELNEVGPTITAQQVEALCQKVYALAKENDIVVLSGSVPNGVSKDIYASMTLTLKQRGVKVILDADGELFAKGIEAIPSVIKPNKYELCKHFNVSEEASDQEVVALGRKLLAQGMDMVVISMGKEGALFIQKEQALKVNGLRIQAQSSVGAGDAMVAALAYAMEQQLPMEEVVQLAVATSAGACESKGTQPADLTRVKELIQQVEIQKVEEV